MASITIDAVFHENLQAFNTGIQNKYTQHILFSGSSTDNISLSDSANNYDFIEILYAYSNAVGSKRFAKLGGWSSQQLCLNDGYWTDASSGYYCMQLRVTTFQINSAGTLIDRVITGKWVNIGRSTGNSTVRLLNNAVSNGSAPTTIYQVIGYKGV